MACNNETDQNSFKPIKSRIILDFSDCGSLVEVHELLKDKFGFPEYYGKNWDALWDCLDGRFGRTEAFLIELHGFSSMNGELREYCAPMLEIFDEIHTKFPNVSFAFID